MTVIVLSGFPIALLLGWAFEFTPTGIHHTPETTTTSEIGEARPRTRKSILLLAGVGLFVSVLARALILPRVVVRKLDKSIAVLPFESFSDKKENAYFADGIQDDILTSLVR